MEQFDRARKTCFRIGPRYLRIMFGKGEILAGTCGYDAGARGPFSGGQAQLSDAEIRAALFAASEANEQHLVLPEVECWRGYVRADYVLVSDSAFSVIEIKSDRD